MKRFSNHWRLGVSNHDNWLRHSDQLLHHHSMQMFVWLHSLVFMICVFLMVQLTIVWMAYQLTIAGIIIALITIHYTMQYSTREKIMIKPVANLSQGSVCVWKMDQEA